MSTRFGRCIFLAASCLACAVPAVGVAAGQAKHLGPPEDVSLTLYSDGQALVRQRRQASLPRGRNRVLVAKLPAGIDSSSIRVEADGVTLIEVREGSPNTRVPNGESLGEWVLETERSFDGQMTVSYLVPGIQYSASLDVVFDSGGGTRLDGWISIRNATGIRYADASVVLVTAPARKPQNASPQGSHVRRREVPLADRVTLAASQRRRVRVLSLRPELDPERIVVEGGRLREYDAQLPPGQRMGRGDLGTTPVHAELRRRLRARDVDALARALPPLTRRVYLKRNAGLELLYEDELDPVSMSPEVSMRRASDIRVDRRQLQFTRRKDPPSTEETIELVVANSGGRPARVEIVENLFRSPRFEIQASSRDLEIGDDLGRDVATTVLTIAAGKQAKLTYTVAYRP